MEIHEVVQTYTYKHAITVCIHLESIGTKFDHKGWSDAKFLLRTVFSNENGKFYTIVVEMCWSWLICFSVGSPTWWRLSLGLSGSFLVFLWRGALLVRECQMWSRRCIQRNSRRFQWRKMYYCGMWVGSIVSWTIHNVFSQTSLCDSYLPGVLVHAIYNTLLAPATACESHLITCNTEIRWLSLGFVSTVFYRK